MTKSPANIGKNMSKNMSTHIATNVIASATAPGDVHIGQLRIATDRPMSARQAQALGVAFVNRLGASLGQAVRPTRLHIAELVIDASQSQLSDPHAIDRLADSLARRVLDRTPE